MPSVNLNWGTYRFSFFNLRTWQDMTNLFLPYWKVGFILWCRIVTSARETHLQMLLCPSRTNEAAPWTVWELSSTKRGWGILTFPSAALDPALFPALCLQKKVDTPFPSLPDIPGIGITSHLLVGRKNSIDLVVLACFYCGAHAWSVDRVPTLLLFPVFPGAGS